MPFLPEIPNGNGQVINTTQFLGLNRGLSISDGEMADMLNMSSDDLPVLSTRKARGVPAFSHNAVIGTDLTGQVDGMLGTDKLVVCHDGKVYCDGVEVPLELSTEAGMREKKLVSMGAYVCIWPDKVYFNINNLDDCGSLGSKWTPAEEDTITAMMCRKDGTNYDMTEIVVSALPPEEPEDGDLWLDTRDDTDVLRQYSLLYKEWVQVATTYIKIQAPGIGKGLKYGDALWLSGVRAIGDPDPDEGEETTPDDSEDKAGEEHYTGRNAQLLSSYDQNQYGSTTTASIASDTQTIKMEGVPDGATIISAKIRFRARNSAVQAVRLATVNGVNFKTDRYNPPLNEIEIPLNDNKNANITFKFQIASEVMSEASSYGSMLNITDVELDVVWEVIDHSGANKAQLNALNTTNTIYGAGEDYIIVAGILHNTLTLAHSLTAEMKVPDLDYICESNNRIWGCVYQETDGTVVNELRSCALGDFRNWYKFQGTAADSYTVTLGSEGKFTGAYSYQGVPIFFKDGNIHKLTGTMPSNYTVTTIKGRGVQDGSWKSLATVNETLFYKARGEIMAYEGAMPFPASQKLGSEIYTSAVGGGYRDKYYICMRDAELKWCTYVFDTAKALWHKEDTHEVTHMANAGGELVLALREGDETLLRTVGSSKGVDESFDWSATFGTFGYQQEEQKYLSRYNIRAQISAGGWMKVEMQYDSDGKWHHMGTMKSPKLRTYLLPIIPRRCDHCQLRISGKGTVNVYSIARIYENGGDG